jgi:acetyl-CoA carboxylase alpha subunit
MAEKLAIHNGGSGGGGSLGVVKSISLGQYSWESIPDPPVMEFVVWEATYRVEKLF